MWATLTWCSVFSDVVWINLPLLTLHFICDLCPPESYESRLFYYTFSQRIREKEKNSSGMMWVFVVLRVLLEWTLKQYFKWQFVSCFHNEIVLGFRFSPNSVQYSGILMFFQTLAIGVHFLHFTCLSSVISTPSK